MPPKFRIKYSKNISLRVKFELKRSTDIYEYVKELNNIVYKENVQIILTGIDF